MRFNRGSDPGPPSVGYQGNRSLEGPEGTTPTEPQWTPPPEPEWTPPQPVQIVSQSYPVPSHNPSPRTLGDFVDLTEMCARLGKYECGVNESDAKAIRAILVKAIRREIREIEKTT